MTAQLSLYHRTGCASLHNVPLKALLMQKRKTSVTDQTPSRKFLNYQEIQYKSKAEIVSKIRNYIYSRGTMGTTMCLISTL